jgi:hypothetical protein
MRRHGVYQSMTLHNKRGVSLVELSISLAGLAVISGVIAGLFGAGMKAFVYSMRTTAALSGARQVLEGGSRLPGMVWQLRDALWINDLATSSLAVTSSDAVTVRYSISNDTFWNTTQGAQKEQAKNITSLQTQYYNIGDSGLIIQSTSPVSATFATTWVQVQGRGKNRKTYTFFSGARLRNHP